uniref:NADH:quinone oxidoreductase/Mrp antiporter membrane subunit domain-containing protein n=1 Tax=Solanum lycopersicum TaxID=4081 RepID=A0A3Q7ECR7_SOLLC
MGYMSIIALGSRYLRTILDVQFNFDIGKCLITFVMAIGIILTPIYSLSMPRQLFYGYKLFNAQRTLFLIQDRESYFFGSPSFYP